MTDSISPTLESVALLLLGWLLGILSPAIVNAIGRRRENAIGRRAVLAELNELAHRLALASHSIFMHRGELTRERLLWLKSHLERYAGVHDTEQLVSSMRTQLSWSDDQLARLSKASAAASGTGLSMQKYAVPLLDARVSALWSFDTAFTRRLLDIKTNIDLLNELVDRSRRYSDMTFGQAVGDNHRRVVENIDTCYVEYAKRATQLVDRLSELRSLA